MALLASYSGSILPKELTKARKNTSTKAYYGLQPLKACISGVIFDLVPAITRACAEFQILGDENKGYGRRPLNTSQLILFCQWLEMLMFLLSRFKIPTSRFLILEIRPF